MSDNSAYDKLKEEFEAVQRRIGEIQSDIARLNDKIDRLETAKTKLDRCYDNFGDLKESVDRHVTADYTWQGFKYDAFCGYGMQLQQANSTYYNNLDAARDSVNSEIARLENEIAEYNGVLGWLWGRVNTLHHDIENFFNS